MKNILIYFALATIILSCKKDDNSPEQQIPDPNPIDTGFLEDQKINIAGGERNYHLYIPQNPDNSSVVVLMHGNGIDYDKILGIPFGKAPYKVWLDIAEQENIILIVPNGSEGPDEDNGWNDCRNDAMGNPSSNDVLFIETLINNVVSDYAANVAKVFAVGTSNGGHMAIRLAQEMPDKLTAFAAIVASNPVNSKCTNSTMPISALFMNGTEDPINPFEGGQVGDSDSGGNSNNNSRGEVFSAQATIDYWVNRNQTDTIPVVTDFANTNTSDNCTAKKYVYSNGSNNTEVAFYEVLGGGHTEPSIAERYSDAFKWIVKEQNGDIEMANEVWDFFKNK